MDKSICKYNVSMRSLLEVINNEPAGIAFVVDDSNKLCGVVTDGDFRRLLLKGKSLDESLLKSDLGSFVSAKQGESIEELLKKTNKRVRIVPIVNEDQNLVDYFRYEHRVHMLPVAEPDLKGNEFKYLSDAFLSTWISSKGIYIDRFESDFSKYCECAHGVAVSNGTVAIHLAIKALGIGLGDEVIVPSLTFAATINAVLHANATPVIVDVEEDSWCIDPREIQKAITPRTKAVIPVHLYGQPCDMNPILAIAKKNNIYIIEDCAEAHGAEYEGKKVGSFGHISCFSFYGNKIITTGEGGMCLTNSEKLLVKMKMLRDHGMSITKKYWHDEVGFNYRMTNIQAAIGCGQLERINELISGKINIEEMYRSEFSQMGWIQFQKIFSPIRKKVTWLVTLLVTNEKRDELMKALKDSNIDVRPFFYSLSAMPLYKKYVFSSKNAEEVSAKGLNLPTIENIDIKKLRAVFEGFR